MALAAVVPGLTRNTRRSVSAFVEPKPATRVDAAEVAAWCRQRLANYKVPKEFHIVDSLPLLPVGKIDRPLLARRAAAAPAASGHQRRPAAR